MSDSFLGMSDTFWYRIVVGLEVLYLIYVLYVKHCLHKVIDLSFAALKKCQEIRQSDNKNKDQAWQDFDKLVEEIIKENERVTKIEDKFR